MNYDGETMTPDEYPGAEWRSIILNKLESLERGQNDMRADLTDIKVNFVRRTDCDKCQDDNQRTYEGMIEAIEQIEIRVKNMEDIKSRAVGAFFAIQFVIGLGFYLLDRFTRG